MAQGSIATKLHRTSTRREFVLPLELFSGIIVVATNSCASQTALPGQWNNGTFTTFYHTSIKTVLQQQMLQFRLILFSYFNRTWELLSNKLKWVLWLSRTRFINELICARDFIKYRLVIWNKIGYIDEELPLALNGNMINTQCTCFHRVFYPNPGSCLSSPWWSRTRPRSQRHRRVAAAQMCVMFPHRDACLH